MIYSEPIVWRPGQSDVDRFFVDYEIDLVSGAIRYSRPSLRPYPPIVDVEGRTITMTAPRGAFPWDPLDEGVIVYARDGYYDSNEDPIEWDIETWPGSGYAFMVGDILYIVSGLIANDFEAQFESFGQYASTQLNRVGSDPISLSGIVSAAASESGGALFFGQYRSKVFGFYPEGPASISGVLIDQSDVEHKLTLAANAVDNAASVFASEGIFSLDVGSLSDSTAVGSLGASSVFALGNFSFTDWEAIRIREVYLETYGYTLATWDRFFPNTPFIFDRGRFKNHLAVHTDNLAETFVVHNNGRFNARTGFNSRINPVTGVKEWIPASLEDPLTDALGNALSDFEVKRRRFAVFLLDAQVQYVNLLTSAGEQYVTAVGRNVRVIQP